MKKINLSNCGLIELSQKDLQSTQGGISIIRVVGALDGIKGNTEVYIFGIRVY